MRFPTRQELIRYFYDRVLAQFAAFSVGLYSTAIVSSFFETRSITNLWGLLARKTVIDEGMFTFLERAVAVVIGFVVFDIVNRILKPLLERLKPVLIQEIAQFAKAKDWDSKWAGLKEDLNAKRVAFFSALNAAVRNVVKKRFSR